MTGGQANASGIALARKFERLLDEYQSVLTEDAELKEALTGSLRVGYYAPIAPAFLPKILKCFVPESGNVVLHLEEGGSDSAQNDLLNLTHDVILFVRKDVRPAISFDVLVQAPAYCLLPLHTGWRNTAASASPKSAKSLWWC